MDIIIFDVPTNKLCNSSVIVNNNSKQIVNHSKRLDYDKIESL